MLGALAALVVVGGGIALMVFGVPSPEKEMRHSIPRERWACFKNPPSQS